MRKLVFTSCLQTHEWRCLTPGDAEWPSTPYFYLLGRGEECRQSLIHIKIAICPDAVRIARRANETTSRGGMRVWGHLTGLSFLAAWTVQGLTLPSSSWDGLHLTPVTLRSGVSGCGKWMNGWINEMRWSRKVVKTMIMQLCWCGKLQETLQKCSWHLFFSFFLAIVVFSLVLNQLAATSHLSRLTSLFSHFGFRGRLEPANHGNP